MDQLQFESISSVVLEKARSSSDASTSLENWFKRRYQKWQQKITFKLMRKEATTKRQKCRSVLTLKFEPDSLDAWHWITCSRV
jgi:hypothetical protein